MFGKGVRVFHRLWVKFAVRFLQFYMIYLISCIIRNAFYWKGHNFCTPSGCRFNGANVVKKSISKPDDKFRITPFRSS